MQALCRALRTQFGGSRWTALLNRYERADRDFGKELARGV